MQESKWRKCPLCGSYNFYTEIENDKIAAFSITNTGEIVFKDPSVYIKIDEKTIINCLSCSWTGSIEDLI